MCICPITGFRFRLPNYHKDTLYQISCPHPLLECTLGELNQIPLTTNPTENAHLFIAYIWQINQHVEDKVVDWRNGLDHVNLSKLWLIHHFPRIKQLVNWIALNANNSAVATELAGIRITKNTNAVELQMWLDACFEIKEETAKTTMLSAQSKRLLEANRKRQGREETFEEHIGIGSGLEKIHYQVNKTRKNYIRQSLTGKLAQYVQLVTKVVFRTDDYEVTTIQQVKSFCLENLLEDTQDHFNEKRAIIQKLDKTLSKKVSLLEKLGHSAAQAARQDLESNYTIIHEGKEYKNNILNLPENPDFISKVVGPKPKVTIPETEPQRKDYRSDLSHEIAWKIWKRAQTTGQV